jgi:hypothetical protein
MDPVSVLLESEKRFRDLPDPRTQLRANYHGTRTDNIAQLWSDFKKTFRQPDAYADLLAAAKHIEAMLTELAQELAHGEYVSRWSVTAGFGRHADPRLVERFCSEAARAARGGGLIDAGATIPEAVDAWLDAVAVYLHADGDHRDIIEDLAATSADLCARLAAQAAMSAPVPPSRHDGEMERTSNGTSLRRDAGVPDSQQSRAKARRAFVIPKLRDLNWSTQEWGEKAVPPVHYNAVQDYLNGVTRRLRVDTRTRLAKALQVSVHDLPE